MNYDAWLLGRLNDRTLSTEQYMVYWHEYQARQRAHGELMNHAEQLARANVIERTAEPMQGRARITGFDPLTRF